jgi:flagellar protein FlgJ
MDIGKVGQAQADSYHDLGALDDLRAKAQKDPSQALKQVASQFEAMFMQMLLKQMRKSNAAFETDTPFNNSKTQTYRDMHDNQMAMNLSQNGSLGLADLIVAQLDPSAKNIIPASAVRSGSNLSDRFKTSQSGIGAMLQAQTDENSENKVGFSLLDAKAGKSFALSSSVSALNSQTLEKKLEFSVPSKKTVATPPEAPRQTFASPGEFIDTMLPIAKRVAAPAGIEPLALVAQAALETGWGKKVISHRDGNSSHNLFGIKADQRWSGERASVDTLEYRDGVARKEKAAFRSYNSFEECMQDYVSFVSNPRYAKALENGDDAGRYAQELQQAGYATDPNYAHKIESILDSDWFAPHRQD